MSSVKQRRVKRRYDVTGRQEAAAATRASILEAARRLFVAQGYAATTMADVAREAEVALDTIYASIGTKQVLFRALIESAISGTDRAVPAEERDYVRALRAEPNAHRKLALYARALRAIHERLAPLMRVLKDAGPVDEQLAILWRTIAERRASNMRLFAKELVATGQLRADVEVDDAADWIWATNGPELYLLLVGDRGWSPEKYEVWLTRGWVRLLLVDGAS